jgi:hypothetical protein
MDTKVEAQSPPLYETAGFPQHNFSTKHRHYCKSPRDIIFLPFLLLLLDVGTNNMVGEREKETETETETTKRLTVLCRVGVAAAAVSAAAAQPVRASFITPDVDTLSRHNRFLLLRVLTANERIQSQEQRLKEQESRVILLQQQERILQLHHGTLQKEMTRLREQNAVYEICFRAMVGRETSHATAGVGRDITPTACGPLTNGTDLVAVDKAQDDAHQMLDSTRTGGKVVPPRVSQQVTDKASVERAADHSDRQAQGTMPIPLVNTVCVVRDGKSSKDGSESGVKDAHAGTSLEKEAAATSAGFPSKKLSAPKPGETYHYCCKESPCSWKMSFTGDITSLLIDRDGLVSDTQQWDFKKFKKSVRKAQGHYRGAHKEKYYAGEVPAGFRHRHALEKVMQSVRCPHPKCPFRVWVPVLDKPPFDRNGNINCQKPWRGAAAKHAVTMAVHLETQHPDFHKDSWPGVCLFMTHADCQRVKAAVAAVSATGGNLPGGTRPPSSTTGVSPDAGVIDLIDDGSLEIPSDQVPRARKRVRCDENGAAEQDGAKQRSRSVLLAYTADYDSVVI